VLFPENPVKRPALWERISAQLAKEAMCFLINEGSGNPLAEALEPNENLAQRTLARLKASEVCRISAARGQAISPHFAGIREGDAVRITEFLSSPSQGMKIVEQDMLRRDLEIAVINLLFTGGETNTIHIPLNMAPWIMRDANISMESGGLVFTKK